MADLTNSLQRNWKKYNSDPTPYKPVEQPANMTVPTTSRPMPRRIGKPMPPVRRGK